MVIDHIGIVVKSLPRGIDDWSKSFGYKQLTEVVVNTRQKVEVVFMGKDDSVMIKLVKPTDETSPIYRFAQKGGGLHHLCFRCKEIQNGINSLRENRMRLVTLPEPGEAFDNEEIAFLYGNQGLNIELIDTVKRASCIE